MNHKDMILEAFHRHGNKVTLGELLDEGRYSFAHKLTARLSDLRREGYSIECIEGDIPAHNVYVLHERPFFDDKGQRQIGLGV